MNAQASPTLAGALGTDPEKRTQRVRLTPSTGTVYEYLSLTDSQQFLDWLASGGASADTWLATDNGSAVRIGALVLVEKIQ